MTKTQHAVVLKMKTKKHQILNITEMYNYVSSNSIPYNHCLGFSTYYERFTYTLIFFWRSLTSSLRKVREKNEGEKMEKWGYLKWIEHHWCARYQLVAHIDCFILAAQQLRNFFFSILKGTQCQFPGFDNVPWLYNIHFAEFGWWIHRTSLYYNTFLQLFVEL